MTTQRGGQGAQVGDGGDDLPWWFKYLGRAFGIIGGSLAVIFGALNCISGKLRKKELWKFLVFKSLHVIVFVCLVMYSNLHILIILPNKFFHAQWPPSASRLVWCWYLPASSPLFSKLLVVLSFSISATDWPDGQRIENRGTKSSCLLVCGAVVISCAVLRSLCQSRHLKIQWYVFNHWQDNEVMISERSFSSISLCSYFLHTFHSSTHYTPPHISLHTFHSFTHFTPPQFCRFRPCAYTKARLRFWAAPFFSSPALLTDSWIWARKPPGRKWRTKPESSTETSTNSN